MTEIKTIQCNHKKVQNTWPYVNTV